MKKLVFISVLVVFVLALADLSFGQARKNGDVKSIDAYCKTVDALERRHKLPDQVFADIAGMNDDRSNWRKFASEKALDKFREKTETYSIAYNWVNGGRIVASNLTLFSGSGDWAKYVYHYFRPDGSLARVKSELRTFEGDFIVIRTTYFDRNGKSIHKSEQYLDLQTHKPKKPDSGVMGDDSKEIDYYKKTSKLPFAHLLRKK